MKSTLSTSYRSTLSRKWEREVSELDGLEWTDLQDIREDQRDLGERDVTQANIENEKFSRLE